MNKRFLTPAGVQFLTDDNGLDGRQRLAALFCEAFSDLKLTLSVRNLEDLTWLDRKEVLETIRALRPLVGEMPVEMPAGAASQDDLDDLADLAAAVSHQEKIADDAPRIDACGWRDKPSDLSGGRDPSNQSDLQTRSTRQRESTPTGGGTTPPRSQPAVGESGRVESQEKEIYSLPEKPLNLLYSLSTGLPLTKEGLSSDFDKPRRPDLLRRPGRGESSRSGVANAIGLNRRIAKPEEFGEVSKRSQEVYQIEEWAEKGYRRKDAETVRLKWILRVSELLSQGVWREGLQAVWVYSFWNWAVKSVRDRPYLWVPKDLSALTYSAVVREVGREGLSLEDWAVAMFYFLSPSCDKLSRYLTTFIHPNVFPRLVMDGQEAVKRAKREAQPKITKEFFGNLGNWKRVTAPPEKR